MLKTLAQIFAVSIFTFNCIAKELAIYFIDVEGPRNLLTADEVRRTNDTLVFIKDKRPIRFTANWLSRSVTLEASSRHQSFIWEEIQGTDAIASLI